MKIYQQIIKEYLPKDFLKAQDLLVPTIGINISNSSEYTKSKSYFSGITDSNDLIGNKYGLLTEYYCICRIYLSECKKYDSLNLLPENGYLFFYVKRNLDDYNEKHDCKVIYIDETKDNIIDKIVSIAPKNAIKFFRHATFASYQEPEMLHLPIDVDNAIEEIYMDICELSGQDPDIGHQLLGKPQAIQGTVTFHWACKYLNINSANLTLKQKKEIEEIQNDFILLLQIKLDDENLNVDTSIDYGAFYFGIHQEDLKNKKFDNVILEYQTT